tara:strand:- start:81 stop:1025 length:945 start_codon:yes stop_codon:yes gene_type:complete
MSADPELYCPGFDDIIVTSDDQSHDHITGRYKVVHKSTIGVKYEHIEKDVKITFSTKINNIFNGHWRWSKNSRPYTLYYANPSTDNCIPGDSWKNIDEMEFTGQVAPSTTTPQQASESTSSTSEETNSTVYQQWSLAGTVQQECDIYNVYKKCVIHIQEEETFVYYVDVPPGIIRNELTEKIWVKAKPTITYANPVSIPVNTPRTVTIYGLSLNYTDMIYLSAGDNIIESGTEVVDIFSSIPSLSADFPGFTGLPLTYNIESENIVKVDIPSIVNQGTADIIILNTAGYGKLTPTYTTSEWTEYNLQNKVIVIE